MKVTFIPSNVHQGHYVHINEKSTDIVVNLYAYKNIDEYRKQKDEQINNFKFNSNERN